MNIACEYSQSNWSQEYISACSSNLSSLSSSTTPKNTFSIVRRPRLQQSQKQSIKQITKTEQSQSTSTSTSILFKNTRGAAPSKKSTATSNPPTKNLRDIYPDGSYCAFIALDTCGNKTLKNLNAVKDAKRLKQHLCLERKFTSLGELYNSKATNQNIRKLFGHIKTMLKNKANARFILFLACHTILLREPDNEAWICSFGFSRTNLEETSMELRELRVMTTRNDVKHQLLLLDSCHTGMLFMRTRGGTRKLSNYETILAESPVALGISATSANEEAMEYGEGGLFTSKVLLALNDNKRSLNQIKESNPLEKEDKKTTNIIKELEQQELMTAHELYTKISRTVSNDAFLLFNHEQTPQIGSLFSKHKNGKRCEGSMLFKKL